MSAYFKRVYIKNIYFNSTKFKSTIFKSPYLNSDRAGARHLKYALTTVKWIAAGNHGSSLPPLCRIMWRLRCSFLAKRRGHASHARGFSTEREAPQLRTAATWPPQTRSHNDKWPPGTAFSQGGETIGTRQQRANSLPYSTHKGTIVAPAAHFDRPAHKHGGLRVRIPNDV